MATKKIELKEVEGFEVANALLREQLHRERLANATEKREQILIRLALEYGLKMPVIVSPDGAFIEGVSEDEPEQTVATPDLEQKTPSVKRKKSGKRSNDQK